MIKLSFLKRHADEKKQDEETKTEDPAILYWIYLFDKDKD